jgi:eight-cysteine-cluster-containing protein
MQCKSAVLLTALLFLAAALSGCIEPTSCITDAKVCPDGSTVGRNPALNCEFDPCPAVECKGEGETIPVIAEPPECCEGLELIPPKEEMVVGISGYCTALCGDGTCDEIETSYNCPVDCIQCRGQSHECSIENIPCCQGLSAIPLAVIEDGECKVALCGTVCLPCGNGVCDEGEYSCNCSDDCQEEEFCGWSTEEPCSDNSDCLEEGCSGQVCRSIEDEPVTTTCEYKRCYNNEAYGLACSCVEGKCQWA